ncbi:MAG: flagellar assembly protein FliX [Rhodospirillales bacterium]|jgi:hypothetical protein|nr:flagellar assembly protein FliX [Rhodospirillales bacterium]
MKISNVGSTKAAPSTARKRKPSMTGESEFAHELLGSAETPAPAAPVDTHAVGTVESILAVQEVPDAPEERSRGLARQYGDDLLDRLESLRRDILVGAVPKDKLANLARALRAQRGQTDDPRLKEIIDEIELRARVEIAKLTRVV